MTGTVGVVIPNHQGERILPECLDAVLGQTRPVDELTVVDNGSTDGSVALVRERYPDVRLVRNHRNLGFGAASNAGVAVTSTDHVAVLNSDARPEATWLQRLLEVSVADDVWARGGVLLRPTGEVESAGDAMTADAAGAFKLYAGRTPEDLPTAPFEVFAPTGAAPLYRREAFRSLGGYDPRFFLYWEDLDLALRARLAGWRAVSVPSARVVHLLGASSLGDTADWGLVTYHVGRNSLVANVRANPFATVGSLLSLTRQEATWAARVEALLPYLRGRLAGVARVPRALGERRTIVGGRSIARDQVFPAVPSIARSQG